MTPSPIQVPDIDSDEPVAVITIASVAPLEGAPDGERINTFAVAARDSDRERGSNTANALGAIRGSVLRKPLTALATAFALGFVLARVLR